MRLGFSSTVTRVKLAAVLGTNRNLGAARHDPPGSPAAYYFSVFLARKTNP